MAGPAIPKKDIDEANYLSLNDVKTKQYPCFDTRCTKPGDHYGLWVSVQLIHINQASKMMQCKFLDDNIINKRGKSWQNRYVDKLIKTYMIKLLILFMND